LWLRQKVHLITVLFWISQFINTEFDLKDFKLKLIRQGLLKADSDYEGIADQIKNGIKMES
jgi:hypothetical protein